MTGGDYERRFVRIMVDTKNKDGVTWWAQKAAASGSATTADLPDVTFARGGTGYAGELKTTSANHIYVDQDEVAALQRYAKAYGFAPVIIGRFKGEPAFYIWSIKSMVRTDEGKFRGSQDGDYYALRIKEPGTAADGYLPSELTWMELEDRLLESAGVSEGLRQATVQNEVSP